MEEEKILEPAIKTFVNEYSTKEFWNERFKKLFNTL